MKYNEAAFIGQQRSKDAQLKLFEYTGFAMLTYTIKSGGQEKGFSPVGEAIRVFKQTYDQQIIIYFTDEEGYAKAQSKPLNIEEGNKIYNQILLDGIEEYRGDIKTI
jgi:hypothetical protein